MALITLISNGGSGIGFPELTDATLRHAGNLPMDVEDDDPGQVQRYFSGKLPFAVKVPEIKGTRIRRVGGRVTHIKDRDAAYVRYEMPRGRLLVFVYEERGRSRPEVAPLYQRGRRRIFMQRMHGYTVARWSKAGLVYSVVTDLPEKELPAILTASER